MDRVHGNCNSFTRDCLHPVHDGDHLDDDHDVRDDDNDDDAHASMTEYAYE